MLKRHLVPLLRAQLARGVLNGNPAWLAIGGVIALRVVVRRLAGSTPEVVFRQRLAPGEGFLIQHLHERHSDTPPPSRP